MDRRAVGSARIIRGNALALPLADESVDLVVTSPPYFGLRSYQDAGEHYAGQIGAEATPAEFVDALIAATREMVRVLKPSGSIWVNLGDKYAGGGMGGHSNGLVGSRPQGEGNTYRRPRCEVPTKSLIGVPWRYALRCIDELGLILRAEVIWSKPNSLPESVTDRVRRSHETWFHFTRSPRYFSAVDEIREPHEMRPQRRSGRPEDLTPRQGPARQSWSTAGREEPGPDGNPLGKLPGSVWTIPTQPLRVPAELGIDHFAAFPMEWPRRIIQGWSPAGVCTACGEGRRPVVAKERRANLQASSSHRGPGAAGLNATSSLKAGAWSSDGYSDVTITGYSCACPDTSAPTAPGVVLDPFGGTGTTALVAKALGRQGIHVDMSADYCRLATWRTNDPAQIAKAMQVKPTKAKKPAKQVEGQVSTLDLFEDGISA